MKSIPSSQPRNGGFLRYWTVSNVPLFLLAIPSFALLLTSAWRMMKLDLGGPQTKRPQSTTTNTVSKIVRAFALTQIALTLTIASSYHVQIINRLSSGYPLWYMWLAFLLCEGARERHGKTKTRRFAKMVVRWMVIYAVVQGVLFASFLPPA